MIQKHETLVQIPISQNVIFYTEINANTSNLKFGWFLSHDYLKTGVLYQFQTTSEIQTIQQPGYCAAWENHTSPVFEFPLYYNFLGIEIILPTMIQALFLFSHFKQDHFC